MNRRRPGAWCIFCTVVTFRPELHPALFVCSVESRVEQMRKQSAIAGVIGAGLLLASTASADPYNPADRAIGGVWSGPEPEQSSAQSRAAGVVPASVRRSAGASAPSRALPPHLHGHITAITAIRSLIVPIEPDRFRRTQGRTDWRKTGRDHVGDVGQSNAGMSPRSVGRRVTAEPWPRGPTTPSMDGQDCTSSLISSLVITPRSKPEAPLGPKSRLFGTQRSQ
jgi:hypothetical protein